MPGQWGEYLRGEPMGWLCGPYCLSSSLCLVRGCGHVISGPGGLGIEAVRVHGVYVPAGRGLSPRQGAVVPGLVWLPFTGFMLSTL